MAKLRAFAVLFGLGLLAVVSLLPTIDPPAVRSLGQVPPVTDAALRLLLLVQPALLVAIGTLVGLRSLTVDRALTRPGPKLGREDLAWGLAGGLLAGAIIVSGDLVLAALADGNLERLRVAPD